MKTQFRNVILGVLLAFQAFPFGTPVQAASDNILSANIKEADGTSGQDTNSGAGVKTAHIQNGAVTDAKISGVISVGKLPIGTTSGTVASGDHDHNALYQGKYGNVIVVAKSGGDFADPISAINSITNASSANPYLLKIMPGVYDLGSGTLSMKEYVDIEGAGENATVIASAFSGGLATSSGVVRGASNAELRFLTVVSTGGGNYAAAIVNDNASPRLTHLSTIASGTGTNGNYAIYNSYSSPVISTVTATASGAPSGGNFAVYNNMSSAVMDTVIATSMGASGNIGIFNNGGHTFMTNVTAIASGTGSSTNYAVYNSDATATMTDVTATATGGSQAWAITTIGDPAPALVNNLTVTASGASVINTGLYIANCSPTISNATIFVTGSGGAYLTNTAIQLYNAYPTLTNISASAKGEGVNNYGIFSTQNMPPSVTFVDRSTFEGSILTDVAATMKIGASKLMGSVSGGTFTCSCSYNSDYAPLSAACE